MRWIFFAVLCLAFGWAAEAQAAPSAERCLAATPAPSLGMKLKRSGIRLKTDKALRIVALGSSSTAGLWSGGRGFPEILADELRRLSGADIHVVNSGQLGDTITGALKRIERDVSRHAPDLVIWQLGTNDVVWGGNVSAHTEQAIASGITTLRAAGSDVVLMDLQYAPAVHRAGQGAAMQQAIQQAARQHKVGLFSRFSLFHNAVKAGVSPSELNSLDGLHHARAGYDCIGRALARAIYAATR